METSLRKGKYVKSCCYLICAVTLAAFVACSGAATSNVSVQPQSPPTPPVAISEATTIEGKISQLPKDEQRYARAAIHGIAHLTPGQMDVGDIGKLQAVEVFQVAGPQSFLAKSDGELFIVNGISTSDLVDGRSYAVGKYVFLVEGTQRYVTALGSTKQVLSLRRMDTTAADVIVQEAHGQYHAKIVAQKEADAAERQRLADAKEAARQQEIVAAAEREAEKKAADRELRRRMWKSADGQFSVEAEFLSYGAGKVKLKRLDDGKELSLDEDVLSPEDMAWIRKRLRN